ncbi:MAG: VanZ family protein [Lachnospiraceae bacterium]|nr:VanZ family protein [Lachnospiraceae bacterium]
MESGKELINRMQNLFSAEEMMIFAVVLACVTLLPVVVCVFHRRSSVRMVSMVVFAVYIAGNLSFTILNREVISDSAVVLNPMRDFESAFYLDLGVIGTIRSIFQNGLQPTLSTIHIESRRMAKEVLLNVLLYIPMGYLLPFVWKKMRHIWIITVIGFLCSCATEFAQLYFRIGYFQVDDIVCNTIGTMIGALIGVTMTTLWRIR